LAIAADPVTLPAMRTRHETTSPDPIAARIRSRRLERGLSVRELASRAGLKAGSFVLHIENSERLPSPDVAGRLAEALGDDPSLYRAWATARRRGDVTTTLAAAMELAGRLAALGSAAGPGPGPAARTPVPLIAEGADPGDGAGPACAVLDRVEVDVRFLPATTATAGPFAVRASAASSARCRGTLRPGEVAVVARGGVDELFPHRVYAVRHAGGVALGHAATVADTVLVAGRDPDVPELRVSFDPRRRERVLLGRVVLTLRPWL
jgi:transcriptional regulator with XRE-family HTH domain